MTTVPHCALCDDNGKILERVKDGETIDVTLDGEVVARLIPPSLTPFDRLTRAGATRPARSNRVDFRTLARVRTTKGTASMLEDLRGGPSSAH